MAIFKCMTCGNLHGAAVTSCGMCHSGAIEQVHEETTPGTLPPAAGLPADLAAGAAEMLRERLDDIAEGVIDFLHTGASFFRAGADWFRSNTDTKRDPVTPAEKWPATSSPTVDGPKKP